MLRVTPPYVNLLVKPRILSGFLEIFLCILKCEMPFKMHKIIFFLPEKEIIKKICVPTLPKIFRPNSQDALIFHLA